jgi:6-phosphogluconolactonase
LRHHLKWLRLSAIFCPNGLSGFNANRNYNCDMRRPACDRLSRKNNRLRKLLSTAKKLRYSAARNTLHRVMPCLWRLTSIREHLQNEVTRMRFSPTKLLHGLLYTAPVILLTLVACGGGGGSSTPALLDVYYTVSGTTSGLTSNGLILRNNGGNDLTVASGVMGFTFPTAINTSYNVTVLSHPDMPTTQKCTVGSGSGPRQSGDISSVTVSCVDAYTIVGSISGLTGGAVVLQNNGSDNLLISANGTFTFGTPVAAGGSYDVTVFSQPNYPARQICTPTFASGSNISGPVTNVLISCLADPAPAPDKYAYAANFGANNVSAFSINVASGELVPIGTAVASGTGPSSVAVDPAGQFAYVTNQSANTISAYSISGGVLVPLDMDALTVGIQNTIASGNGPRAITIHPSGKFAFVANYLANSVSAYSIDAAGVLARIDSNGATTANETSIPARSGPISIAIHPEGGYAYVANALDNNVSVYSIDIISGALTAIDADGSTGGPTYMSTNGTTPYSVKVDPAGQYLYVANRASNQVSIFAIGVVDPRTLSTPNAPTVTDNNGSTPVSIAMHPSKQFAYVLNSGSKTVNVYSTATAGWGINQSYATTGNLPISISIDTSGQYAYVANSSDGTISAYSINPATGELTEVTSSPFPAGTTPYSVTTSP